MPSPGSHPPSVPDAGILALQAKTSARLIATVQQLSLVRTLPAIQAIVRSAAREMAGADGATFVLRDGDRCHYADEDAISPLWKGQKFPMSTCISGWVMLNARPAVIPDIYVDPRIPHDAYRPTFVKSLVMVPIRAETPIGAIGAYWARTRDPSPGEVVALQALAQTTAVAMENVQVFTELEQRVAARTQQLEALNREMEAFSSSVSHDLRAPLRAIGGFTQFLANELGDKASEKARHHLGRIREATTQMSTLIEDLLQMAKAAQQEMRQTEVDLSALAREIAERLRQEQPSRAVELVVADEMRARGDRGLLGVVLQNLLSNAWKYSSKAANPRIEVGVESGPDGTKHFFVRDNGVGFNAAKAEKLFTPFTRLHTAADFPGTGVGLSTVQRVIHRHGGRIWATAEEGRGATFRFTCGSPGRDDSLRSSSRGA